MENKAIDENSGHVSKLVHQFYFVKLWPTVPDSISQIKKDEKVIKAMNQNISEITDKIAKKTLESPYRNSELYKYNSNATQRKLRNYSKTQMDLNMALDELNFRNVKVENGGWFGEKLDKKSLNYLRLHKSKSLGEEKKIIRDIKIQQKDVSPFKSLEVLKETLIRERYYVNRQKLLIEIEQFLIQHTERASMYDSLKKTIKDQIKCDEYLRGRIGCGTREIHNAKKQAATDGELYSLRKKLDVKYKKRDEAHQRILELDKLYHEEILLYYKHCSFMNKVYQLAEEKDVAALDEMSNLEGDKFMLEWNSNMAFREDYKKKFLQSLEIRQLCKDGRRRPDKSCSMLL